MAQLAAAFNQMSEQVHLDEARNQFVSNASHELKTPLATIKILVESMMYQDDMDRSSAGSSSAISTRKSTAFPPSSAIC